MILLFFVLQVFVPERDLIAGTLENVASSDIIAKRCRKVVALFTPGLMADANENFLLDMAQFKGIQDKQNVLIPVMFKRYTVGGAPNE